MHISYFLLYGCRTLCLIHKHCVDQACYLCFYHCYNMLNHHTPNLNRILTTGKNNMEFLYFTVMTNQIAYYFLIFCHFKTDKSFEQKYRNITNFQKQTFGKLLSYNKLKQNQVCFFQL